MAFADHPASGDHHVAHDASGRPKNRRVEQTRRGLLGQRRIVAIEHQQIRATTDGNRAHRLGQRLRPAGKRSLIQDEAARFTVARQHVALSEH